MNFQAEQLSCQDPWISPALLPFLEGTRDDWTHTDVQRWKVRNFQWEAECICLRYFIHFWGWALKLHSCHNRIVMPRKTGIAGNSHVRKAMVKWWYPEWVSWLPSKEPDTEMKSCLIWNQINLCCCKRISFHVGAAKQIHFLGLLNTNCFHCSVSEAVALWPSPVPGSPYQVSAGRLGLVHPSGFSVIRAQDSTKHQAWLFEIVLWNQMHWNFLQVPWRWSYYFNSLNYRLRADTWNQTQHLGLSPWNKLKWLRVTQEAHVWELSGVSAPYIKVRK